MYPQVNKAAPGFYWYNVVPVAVVVVVVVTVVVVVGPHDSISVQSYDYQAMAYFILSWYARQHALKTKF